MLTAGGDIRVRRSLNWQSGWGWARAVLDGILRRISGSPSPRHPFDRRHGVDTDGLIYAEPLAGGHENEQYSAGYYATAPSLFRGAIDLWRGTLAGAGYDLGDYALVDIGCGKGRVLMLATEYEFREMVGIELNLQLARIAGKNLRKWMRRPRVRANVRIVQADALDVALPDGPVVLFFFNSFEQEMVEMWLARLGEIAARRLWPIDLIYVHPEFDALVRRVPGMRTVADAEITLSAEDAGADAFEVAVDRCAVYRFRR